jgi:hypothetical protein
MSFPEKSERRAVQASWFPVSTFKMIDFSGNWSDIKVEVTKDVRGIEIKF